MMSIPRRAASRFAILGVLGLAGLLMAVLASSCGGINDQARANDLVSQGNAIESGAQLKLAEARMMLPLASAQLPSEQCNLTPQQQQSQLQAAQTNLAASQQLFKQASLEFDSAKQKFTQAQTIGGLSENFSKFLELKINGMNASITLSNLSLQIAVNLLADVQLQDPTTMPTILQLQTSANASVNDILKVQADANAIVSQNPDEIIAAQIMAPVSVEVAPLPAVDVNVDGIVSVPLPQEQVPDVTQTPPVPLP